MESVVQVGGGRIHTVYFPDLQSLLFDSHLSHTSRYLCLVPSLLSVPLPSLPSLCHLTHSSLLSTLLFLFSQTPLVTLFHAFLFILSQGSSLTSPFQLSLSFISQTPLTSPFHPSLSPSSHTPLLPLPSSLLSSTSFVRFLPFPPFTDSPSLPFPPLLPTLLSPRSGENLHHNLILFVLLSS